MARSEVVQIPYSERSIGDFAARLFEGTMTVPAGRYREWMLEVLLTEVVSDGALWRRGHEQGSHIHSVCAVGLPPPASQVIARNREINPLMQAMYGAMGRALRLSDASAQASGIVLERFRTRVLRPLGATDVLGIVLSRGNSALETEITLYRGPNRTPFTAEDAAWLEKLAPVMVASATHANFLTGIHPAATHWNRPAALVNSSGRFYDMQSSFVELLDRFFPEWDGQRLPFEMPDHDEHTSFMVRGLNVYAELRGDLSLVRLWERQPLEALSSREREVARAIASGRSYKSVARTLGLSPSTVSNHLQRIYQKLAITNRSELADLVNREAGGAGLSGTDLDDDDDDAE